MRMNLIILSEPKPSIITQIETPQCDNGFIEKEIISIIIYYIY